jgi:tetratricopeptide (TPR) repeat protein
VDQLLNKLKNAAEDTNRVNILCQLSEECSEEDILKYAEPALILAQKLGYKKGIAMAANNVGYVFDQNGELSKALEYYQLALKTGNEINDHKLKIAATNNIGYIYNNQGEITKALEYFLQSLRDAEKLGDKSLIAQPLINIGGIYMNQGNSKKALEYFQRSLKLNKEIGNKEAMGSVLNNLGSIHNNRKEFDVATEYYERSLKVKKEVGDKDGIAFTYDNLASVHEALGHTEKALEYFNKSLAIFEELNNKEGMGIVHFKLANLYIKQGWLKEAETCAGHSLSLGKEIGYPYIIANASNVLKDVYEKTGKYKEAFEMFKLSKKMGDSINNVNTQKVALKKQLQYEFEKKEAETKAEQDKKEAVAAAELKSQRQQRNYFIIGFIMVIVLALFIFRGYREKQKANIIISQQKELVEEKQKEILDSIAYAKRLQEAILPPVELVKAHLPDSFVFYKPKDIVAGDFYWMETVNNDGNDPVILIAAADCTGHGVPGALVSVVCSNALNRAVKEFRITDPGKILDKTRELVIETFEKSGGEVKDGMDISLAAIIHKQNDGVEVKWSGANNPLWYISGGKLNEITANKEPIGKTDKQSSFTTHEFRMTKGDQLYLFTDGYADQFGGDKKKKFKYKPLQERIFASHTAPVEEQFKSIRDTFNTWKGELEQVDDVLLIGIRV